MTSWNDCPLNGGKLMFSYDQVKAHLKLLLTMASLTPTEFEQWFQDCHEAWNAYVKQAYIE